MNNSLPCAVVSLSISRGWKTILCTEFENFNFAFSKNDAEMSVNVYDEKRLFRTLRACPVVPPVPRLMIKDAIYTRTKDSKE